MSARLLSLLSIPIHLMWLELIPEASEKASKEQRPPMVVWLRGICCLFIQKGVGLQ